MPTIDQLAPATSASDADEFVVSQASVAKKITRAQVLNGVQPQIAMPADSLLGRASSGTGAPEVIAVGDNLILNSRTLSATATPFSISGLPTGIVPATGDLVAVSQAGTNVAVTYGQLIGGLSGLANIDVSQALVTPSGTNTEKKLADLAATSLPVSGGTLTGQLSLSGKPVLPAEAANKAYVDERILTALALTGGSMSGTLTLAAAPQSPLDSVTKGYADALAATLLPLSGGSLSGALLLNSDPSNNLQAATKRYADLKLTRTGDTLSGMLTLAADPTGALHASTKNYVDTKVGDALPKSGGTMLGSLVLASDPSVNAQAATKQYVDQRVLRAGDTLIGTLTLAGDPALANHATNKNYVDTQVAGSVSRSGSSMSGALLLASDPAAALQASTKQYVDLRVARNGDTLTGALYLASNPTSALQAATKQYVDGLIATTVTRSGVTFTGPVALASDPTSSLQAATKQYVDGLIATTVTRTGVTFTGPIALASDPTSSLQAATKQYVDGLITTTVTRAGATFTGPVVLAGDPTSLLQAATKQYADTKLSRSGDTLSGALILSADPTAPAQAATKNYVDTQLLGALPRSGGSLTGALSLSADPTGASQAATKRYVDTQIATALPLTGGTITGAVSLATSPTATSHLANKQYVDSQVATALPRAGGTLSGALVLSAAPTLPLQAATKSYVDANPDTKGVINVAMPPYGAKLDGITDDTAAFKTAYLAAPAGSTIYVPYGKTVLQPPGSWGIAISKRVKWVVDGTVLSDGTPLASSIPTGGAPCAFTLPGVVVGSTPSGLSSSQAGSQTSDFAVSQSCYIVSHTGGQAGSVITNSRTDTIIYGSPGNYIWGGLDRLLWSGLQAPTAGTPVQHVARYVQTLRQAATTGADGQALPQPELWAACLEYRDTTGKPSSATSASITIEMDWVGNGLDDASNRAIQSLVIAQHDTSGAAVEVSNVIGVYLGTGSTGSAKSVFQVAVPFSNAVLDTTHAQSISSAPAIKLAAGQAIAFEATGSNTLSYDSTTATLRWKQGDLSYPVGKGITVGFQTVCFESQSLPSYISGSFVFLAGTGAYTITLPPANTVAFGTGFTFSVIGTATVSIVPSGADGIDCGSVVLRAYDRYHVVSDQYNTWREVFRTNAVSPRFTGPVVLPSYTVASLPTGMPAGAKAFASNGRKGADAIGAGTGVEVFYDGTRWVSTCSGTQVTT